jgi:hypothetical protein
MHSGFPVRKEFDHVMLDARELPLAGDPCRLPPLIILQVDAMTKSQ